MERGALSEGEGLSPIELARRFYYDGLVMDGRALRFLIDLIGHQRVLVGSDFPAMPREDPCARTLRTLELEPDALEDISCTTPSVPGNRSPAAGGRGRR